MQDTRTITVGGSDWGEDCPVQTAHLHRTSRGEGCEYHSGGRAHAADWAFEYVSPTSGVTRSGYACDEHAELEVESLYGIGADLL